MTNDERARIEAAAKAMFELGGGSWEHSCEEDRCRYVLKAEAALQAADALRTKPEMQGFGNSVCAKCGYRHPGGEEACPKSEPVDPAMFDRTKPESDVLRKAKVLSQIWTSKGEVNDPDVLFAIGDLHDAICALYSVDPKVGFQMYAKPESEWNEAHIRELIAFLAANKDECGIDGDFDALNATYVALRHFLKRDP